MQVESELTRNAEKMGEVSRYSDMTSGHIGNQVYGGEGCEKNLGGGEPCAGADTLGGGGSCAGDGTSVQNVLGQSLSSFGSDLANSSIFIDICLHRRFFSALNPTFYGQNHPVKMWSRKTWKIASVPLDVFTILER
jgi:hypothetical protein